MLTSEMKTIVEKARATGWILEPDAKRMLDHYEVAEVSASKANDRQRSSNSMSVRETERITTRDLKELATGEAYISTQITKGTEARNPFWRMRFPLPEFGDWQSMALPVNESSDDLRVGLRFWERYLNPYKLDEIRNLAQEIPETGDIPDLRPSLDENPGWGGAAC